MRRLLWLDGSLATDPVQIQIGGKAIGLGRLCRLGANVPEGFVVPADVVLTCEVEQEIDAMLEGVVHAFGRETSFAVRSSAIAEDGAFKSYAGMFATLLDVPAERVVAAVRECRGSVFSRRVASYRAAVESSVTEPGMAVVVQRMLHPTVAGVYFTVNPVTLRYDEFVIEVVQGVGERLVSGEITPDYFCVRAWDGTLMGYDSGGEGAGPLLSPATLLVLWREIKRVRDLLGYPVDIEFAFVGGDLYILQARPITTLAA